MSAEKILGAWKKKDFKAVYWLEGEEDYYIDLLMNYAENHILPESEASFNLTVFYGKDADWAAVINACKRYPMFAERQVVLLKEAQQLSNIEKLEPYIENPLSSTIFVVGYKGKTLDKRTKLYKLLGKNAEVLNSAKIRDEKIQEWIADHVKTKGFTMGPKAVILLAEHIGNDLSRISNEIDKLAINLDGRKNIDEDDIEKYIGISKEYNVFEFPKSILSRNAELSFRIANFFMGNLKDNPLVVITAMLYTEFNKLYKFHFTKGMSQGEAASLLKVSPYFLKDYERYARQFSLAQTIQAIHIVAEYNQKSVGINTSGSPTTLLKELTYKLLSL